MEEGNLDMGMFDNMELNFDLPSDFLEDNQEEIEETSLVEDDNINDTVEDESSEEVDSEEDDVDEGGEGSNSSSNLYSSLATVIHEDGLLPSLDINKTPIKTIEDLTGAFKTEIQIQAQAMLDDYLANIDVSQVASSTKAIQELDTITEDTLKADVSLAKELILRDYLNQGLAEAKATRMLKRLIDLGEDAILEDATESLTSLKEFESRKIESEKASYQQRLEQEKVQQAKMEQQLKETIYDRKDLIQGLKPTKAVQDKVYKTITEIVGKSPVDGTFENKFMKERRENPLEFETRMYYLYELTNGFKDFSKVTASAKSNAVSELEKIVRKSKVQDNGTPLWMQDNNSYDGPGHVLNL
jgi:hypothetical protein